MIFSNFQNKVYFNIFFFLRKLQGSTLSLTNDLHSLDDFEPASIMTSRLSILALLLDNTNPNSYYLL